MPIKESSRIIDFLKSPLSPKIGELRFRCQWTLRYSEIPLGPPEIQNLPMMTWRNTSHVAPQNHTTKSIIRPGTVDSMGVHGVQKFRNSKFSVKLIDPEEAVVRHYRLVDGWNFFLKEAESFGEFFEYKMTDRLAGEILKRVKARIEEFSKFSGENK